MNLLSSTRAALGGGCGSRIAELIDAFPVLSAAESRLAKTLYRLLARGNPVAPAELAQHDDLSTTRTGQLLSGLRGMLDYDDDGRIVAFLGLDTRPSQNQLVAGRTKLYAWCALDTLLLPGLLGRPLTISAVSAMDGVSVGFRITPRGFSALHPADTLVSLVLPEGEAWRRDVRGHFSRFVHFFHDANEANRWQPKLSQVFFLPIGRAYLLAAVLAHRLFGEVSSSAPAGVTEAL